VKACSDIFRVNSSAVVEVALDVRAQASLKAHNSFGIDVSCRYLITVDDEATLVTAIGEARRLSLPWLILGGGSNVLFVEDFAGIVIHLRSRGIEATDIRDGLIAVHVAGGENWHDVVCHCMAKGWYGLENLALIPGSAGAAPVQNIGAYGVELADRLQYVDVLDLDTLQSGRMPAHRCQLAYRDSVFKGSLRGRCIITGVGLSLSSVAQPVFDYPSLKRELDSAGHGNKVTAEQVFEAVCRVRQQRLPDPALLGNAGSFFKNPIVSREHCRRLRRRYPGLPAFDLVDDKSRVKVPAAWLIEQLGWKGVRQGAVGVHEHQALVLVNHGGAAGTEVLALAQQIMRSVQAEFDIQLQPEVRIIGGGGELA